MNGIANQNTIHVAIIMDGNGRWAQSRGLPRIAGHRRGATSVRRVVEVAPELGIRTLTLYAFSSDNWKRPASEVSGLMFLLEDYLKSETARCIKEGVRVVVIGSRDRLSQRLRDAIAECERATAKGRVLLLRIAIDYSARNAIFNAAQRISQEGIPSREQFALRLCDYTNCGLPCPDVDLLIRTGGEKRLSDFLLWECAYAELYFTDTMWPEFGKESLAKAIQDFRSRERRFGEVFGTNKASQNEHELVTARGDREFWLH
jgi:undecaprenyl diphosphate synthase